MKRYPLLLVLYDLWYFVTKEYCQLLPTRKTPLSLNEKHHLNALPHATSFPLLLPKAEPVLVLKSLERSDSKKLLFLSPEVMYVISATATCWRTPEVAFDNVLTTLTYGDAVTVTAYHGRYAKVFWSHHEGWVEKDVLTTQKKLVWPTVQPGVVYSHEHEVTKKIRKIIKDSFQAGELALPLQAVEWITFHFREMHRTIPWPMTCGRWPGDWQTILRGTLGVHAGIYPKTDSIMEWRAADGIGRLAYVERVTPEQNITISVVGFDEAGLYEVKDLAVTAWRELRPVFIEIS